MGEGVRPDIIANKEGALRMAHIAALERVIKNPNDNNREKVLMDIIEILRKTTP
jgi:hypothetical protein